MLTLYVVATPIGNLDDASPRLKKTLSAVEAVLCEDTRVAKKLCAALGITTPRLIALHAQSTEKQLQSALAFVTQSTAVALVTDAGTPAISDPGAYFLDRLYAVLPDAQVVPVPGPNAAVAALSVAGFYADRFLFLGFPPHQKGRAAFFAEVAAAADTVVFFESVHRIEKTLVALQSVLSPERRLCVCRELTKIHETVVRGKVADVAAAVRAQPARGEYVVVVERNR